MSQQDRAHGERPPLALQLAFLGKHAGYLLERHLSSHGLNRTQAMVLIALHHHPGLKALDLCGPARVEPANVTRTLQSLERLDLLERRPHPTDGRASLFYLTRAGENKATALSRSVEQLSAALVSELSPEDAAHLDRLLAGLRSAISRHLTAFGGLQREHIAHTGESDSAAGSEMEDDMMSGETSKPASAGDRLTSNG